MGHRDILATHNLSGNGKHCRPHPRAASAAPDKSKVIYLTYNARIGEVTRGGSDVSFGGCGTCSPP